MIPAVVDDACLSRWLADSKKAGTEPASCHLLVAADRLAAAANGLALLHRGRCAISGDRAMIPEDRGIGDAHAQGQSGNRGKEQVLHRNSPSESGEMSGFR